MSLHFVSGLDALHELTSSKSYQLRVDISDWDGLTAHVLHATITVADESDFYRLTLGEILDGEAGIASNLQHISSSLQILS